MSTAARALSSSSPLNISKGAIKVTLRRISAITVFALQRLPVSTTEFTFPSSTPAMEQISLLIWYPMAFSTSSASALPLTMRSSMTEISWVSKYEWTSPCLNSFRFISYRVFWPDFRFPENHEILVLLSKGVASQHGQGLDAFNRIVENRKRIDCF